MKKFLTLLLILSALPLAKVALADVSILDPSRLSIGLSIVDDLRQNAAGKFDSHWNVGIPMSWQITAQPVKYPLSLSARPGYDLKIQKPEIRVGFTILLKRAG